MSEELWMEVHDIVQEAVIKTIHKKERCEKAKWLSEEGLQIAERRSERHLPTMWETWVRPLGWEDPPREGNGNPLQYSCLENPMDGGAW